MMPFTQIAYPQKDSPSLNGKRACDEGIRIPVRGSFFYFILN